MGYVEGLLSGFLGRKREIELQNMQLAQQASARESKVYETLLGSSDPEIQSMALTGLLTSGQAQRRTGGLRGWLGEMEANPITARIRSAINTPVETQEPTRGLPSQQFSGYMPARPPVTSPLAQPETAATEPGAPPLATVASAPAAQVGAPPPGIAAPQAAGVGDWEAKAAPVTGSRTVMKPRQVFRTPEKAMLLNRKAASQGEVEGEVAGLVAAGIPEDQARAAVLKKYQRYAGMSSGFQSIPGELPDGTPAFGVFDRASGQYLDDATHQPLEGFRPRTTTGSVSLGADRESIARELFGKSAKALTSEQMAVVNQRLTAFGGERAAAVTTGRGEAAANVPLNTQQRYQATSDLSKQWMAASESYRTVQQQFSMMKAALSRVDADPIGASQGVLVTFQKVLDPNSVVRESEYARSPQGLSLLDWLEGKVQQYQAGGVGVPKPVLAEMVKTAELFTTDANIRSGYENVRQRIQDTATSYEIDPRLVLGGDYRPGSGAVAAPTGRSATPSPRVGAPPPGSAPRATQDASGNWVIAVP